MSGAIEWPVGVDVYGGLVGQGVVVAPDAEIVGRNAAAPVGAGKGEMLDSVGEHVIGGQAGTREEAFIGDLGCIAGAHFGVGCRAESLGNLDEGQAIFIGGAMPDDVEIFIVEAQRDSLEGGARVEVSQPHQGFAARALYSSVRPGNHNQALIVGDWAYIVPTLHIQKIKSRG